MDAAAAARLPAIDLADEPSFCVGAATVDPASRDARYGEQAERLQPQNLKVLVALARHRNRVVTRDQLVDLCWDGRFVGDDVINRAISTLRQFAERAAGFSIETVPRVGYRLVDRPKGSGMIPWMIGPIVLLFLLAAFVGAVLMLRPRPESSPASLTVAILPFEVGSPDRATRAFAFAAHDSVANALSQSRYAVTEIKTGADYGRRADFVLSGNVSGGLDKVIATIRMEETAHHIIVYSRRFEVHQNQAWTLQERIGPQVAGDLGWTEPMLLVDRAHPSDPAVLRTLFAQTGPPAIDTIRRVATEAPDSAVAQIMLAWSAAFSFGDLPRERRAETVAIGRRATDRSVLLAPEFGGSYIPWCLLHSIVRLQECEHRLRSAIVTDPDSPWVDFFLAREILQAGRADDALELSNHSLADDQFAPAKIALSLEILEATEHPTDAAALYARGTRWWPDFGQFFWFRVHGMVDRGDFGAITRFERDVGSAKLPKDYVSAAPLAAALRSHSARDARSWCANQPGESLQRTMCVVALARLNDLDAAFRMADELYPRRVGRTEAEEERIWLDQPNPTETEFVTGAGAAPLRADPRFLQLADRTGLLAYWRSGHLPDFCTKGHEPICARITAVHERRSASV
jgi:DNA-binding winged helix-turn-helix (wHTH) protein/TolB-like protein